MKKFLLALFAVVCIFTVVSCGDVTDTESGSILVKVFDDSLNTKAIVCNIPDVSYYLVYFDNSTTPDFRFATKADAINGKSFSGIHFGRHTIKVEAYNFENVLIGVGTDEFTLSAHGNDHKLNVEVKPLTDVEKPTLTINVKADTGFSVPGNYSVYLLKAENTEDTKIEGNKETDNWTFTELSPGNYAMVVTVDNTPIYKTVIKVEHQNFGITITFKKVNSKDVVVIDGNYADSNSIEVITGSHFMVGERLQMEIEDYNWEFTGGKKTKEDGCTRPEIEVYFAGLNFTVYDTAQNNDAYADCYVLHTDKLGNGTDRDDYRTNVICKSVPDAVIGEQTMSVFITYWDKNGDKQFWSIDRNFYIFGADDIDAALNSTYVSDHNFVCPYCLEGKEFVHDSNGYKCSKCSNVISLKNGIVKNLHNSIGGIYKFSSSSEGTNSLFNSDKDTYELRIPCDYEDVLYKKSGTSQDSLETFNINGNRYEYYFVIKNDYKGNDILVQLDAFDLTDKTITCGIYDYNQESRNIISELTLVETVTFTMKDKDSWYQAF